MDSTRNLKNITAFMTSFDKFGETYAIGDKGFYSKRNIEELVKRSGNFIIAIRPEEMLLNLTVVLWINPGAIARDSPYIRYTENKCE